ncbi:MAG TPA: NAD(P)H-hydrate dehydratase [Jatrophihabitans sp.]|nr:NAD(P)H-hydrate dehydratase [Jatrophihabitans sp.]
MAESGMADPHVISPQALRDWPLPEPQGSKRSRGQVLVAGGGRTTPGAAVLAGLAALRVGAGVLTLAVAESVAAAVGAAVPEAGVLWLPENDQRVLDGGAVPALADRLAKSDVLLVGPGLDDPDGARSLLQRLAPELPDGLPVVLDAFAIGVLPDLDRPARSALAGRLVLTPNSTELRYLNEAADQDSEDEVTLDELRAAAEQYQAVLSCHNQVIRPDGRAWSVPAGHPGLGTSGSGDVLAGAVAGLLARGAELDQATCWATYLHATAGERLAAPVGPLGFLAGELLGQLPLILAELRP